MSDKKCAQCGLVNWPDAVSCGRCNAPLTGAGVPATGNAAATLRSGRVGRRSGKSQVVRALLWAVVLHVALGVTLMLLAGLYDAATGAPPRQTGAPHNFPKNPFILVAILVISPCFAPVAYLLIAGALFLFFERREGRKSGNALDSEHS